MNVSLSLTIPNMLQYLQLKKVGNGPDSADHDTIKHRTNANLPQAHSHCPLYISDSKLKIIYLKILNKIL